LNNVHFEGQETKQNFICERNFGNYITQHV